ncbi:hypothetical protein J6590_025283 [Homalodisca vitripennis]|nr:hypothetical protein J6590_025283 [Homalodisca vitripennis]
MISCLSSEYVAKLVVIRCHYEATPPWAAWRFARYNEPIASGCKRHVAELNKLVAQWRLVAHKTCGELTGHC